MTVAAPLAGECATHPGVKADWACQRCGSFVCDVCERRTRPEAPPLCPKCWAMREQSVQTQEITESKKLQISGLFLGLLSIHPLMFIASLVLNIRELRRRKEGRYRWMNQAGLALSGISVFVWLVLLVWIINH